MNHVDDKRCVALFPMHGVVGKTFKHHNVGEVLLFQDVSYHFEYRSEGEVFISIGGVADVGAVDAVTHMEPTG